MTDTKVLELGDDRNGHQQQRSRDKQQVERTNAFHEKGRDRRTDYRSRACAHRNNTEKTFCLLLVIQTGHERPEDRQVIKTEHTQPDIEGSVDEVIVAEGRTEDVKGNEGRRKKSVNTRHDNLETNSRYYRAINTDCDHAYEERRRPEPAKLLIRPVRRQCVTHGP